jgi:VCBS repeat-containing protein
MSCCLWNANALDNIDVVVLGGVERSVPLDGQIAYQFINDFYQAGGGVVTTGGALQQFGNLTGISQTYLDNITPVTVPSATVFASGAGRVVGPAHPITNDILDTGVANSNFAVAYSSRNFDRDGGTQVMTSAGGAGTDDLVTFRDGVVGGEGNAAFVGFRYLDHIVINAANDAQLRVKDPDFLLEQAIAWAAGVDKVNENTTQTFTPAMLLANDAGVSGTATISATTLYSANGATLRQVGANIAYDPTTSQIIDNLAEGAPFTDTFVYKVEDGGDSATATVSVTLFGTDDILYGDDPIIPNPELNGFGAGNSSQYRYGATLFQDDDEGTGIQYAIYRSGSIGDPPTGVTFDASTATFTFMSTAQTNYLQDMTLYAYEADGQNKSVEVGFSVDSSGDLRFVYTNYDQADGGPALEIAFDDTAGFTGAAPSGLGVSVDLSGIDTLAPSVLANVAVLDIRNNQENLLSIDHNDLLALLGTGPITATHQVTIEADIFDNIETMGGGPGWSATIGTDTVSGNDQIDYTSDGTNTDFGGNGDLFARLTIDGADASFVME